MIRILVEGNGVDIERRSFRPSKVRKFTSGYSPDIWSKCSCVKRIVLSVSNLNFLLVKSRSVPSPESTSRLVEPSVIRICVPIPASEWRTSTRVW